jgi:RNA-directed DNA polymerase
MIQLFETKSTTVPITKQMVRDAYRKVKSNHGAAGVDQENLEDFESNLLNNLYKLWNRLGSGSYFPQPVREVMIPKSKGGSRKLGIPTVSDRIAQQVIKAHIEPRLETIFHNNSYGYRPDKSAHHAIEAVQTNVRQYAWVIDMDIKNFFDEVDHELLMKALEVHVEEKWVKMYIRRWLETSIQTQDGTLITKEGKGTPQGGVISPLLSNLYLHYVLDKWLEKHYPQITFVRYADDVLIHCRFEGEAKLILRAIQQRLHECKLQLNEDKTKIVYCQNYKRKVRRDYGKKFDFLGFTFKPQTAVSKEGGLYLCYACSISQAAQTRIIEGWKKSKFHKHPTLTLQEIATRINPQITGIIRYYGKYRKWTLRKLFRRFHYRLASWVLRKYKRFKGSHRKAYKWIAEIQRSYPGMFYHWTFYNKIVIP